MHETLTSPRRDATYSVPASEVVSNRLVARGDGMSSPGFMIAHLILLPCCPGSMYVDKARLQLLGFECLMGTQVRSSATVAIGELHFHYNNIRSTSACLGSTFIVS